MLLSGHWRVDAGAGQPRQRSLADAVAHIDSHTLGGDSYIAADRDLWPDAYSMDATADQNANANQGAERHDDEYSYADPDADSDADSYRDGHIHAHAAAHAHIDDRTRHTYIDTHGYIDRSAYADTDADGYGYVSAH